MQSTETKYSKVVIASAVAGVLALAAFTPVQAADKMETEKCYGVAKAGKNDCQTPKSSCAGTSKKDGDKNAFVLLPKGSCEKIVNASLMPAK